MRKTITYDACSSAVELLTIEEVNVSETLLVAGSNPVKHLKKVDKRHLVHVANMLI